ncbi:MAG: 30S ribosomal protein S7 [Aggregatilineales bacterium]
MRRKTPEKREVIPDVKYNSVEVTMFVNRMMYGGKKSTAFRIMYQAFDIIQERMKTEPLEIFETALRNASPTVEVKARRVGGSTYQVPIEVLPARARALGMRWLLASARKRGGRTMASKLANELMDTAQGTGETIKTRDNVHRMAEANRAFAHFR